MFVPLLLLAGFIVVARSISGGQSTSLLSGPSQPPPPPPSPPSVSILDQQRTAAQAFIDYIVNQGGRDKASIKKLQTAMGGLVADGIVGPKTRDRAEELVGHQIVWPPDVYDPLKEMLSPPAKQVTRTEPVVVKATVKAPPAPGQQDSSAALPAESPADAMQAAHDLLAYVQSGGRDRDMVAGFQRRIAVDPDGIVGPHTKARVEQLLGGKQQWPSDAGKAQGPAPSPATPGDAARELDAYLKSGGKTKTRIAAYQKAMGGVTADGIAGPKTKARIKELLGG